MKRKLLMLSPVFFLACNVDHSLGSTEELSDASAGAGADATTTSPPPLADGSTPSTVSDATKPEPPTGELQHWTGYAENFKFGSESDRIQLAFTVDGVGNVLGTVTFGNGIAPPPATDPNVGYPPSLDSTGPMPATYLEGPAYVFKTGSLESNRLRFTIDMADLWWDWCKLQPAPTDGSDICVPNWGGESLPGHTVCYLFSPSGETVPIDCIKWDLCLMSRICKCAPSGCNVNYEDSGYKLSFDVFLANGAGNGSMSGNVFGPDHNVHFLQN